jgi:hypothetical protein
MVAALCAPETRVAPNELRADVCSRKPSFNLVRIELPVEFPLPAFLHQAPDKLEVGSAILVLER